jgi:Fe-S cluster biogenesis protein NfuA
MTLREDVERALDEVRPHLQIEGGDIELVDVEGDVVKVRLKGACMGCPMSQMTLRWGVESFIKRRVPGVRSVEAV